MSQPHSDLDPLLEFAIEPGAAPVPLPSPSEPVEPVASPVVSVASTGSTPSADQLESLRLRIDRLEKSVSESAKNLLALQSEVATLVGAIADIRKRISRAAPAAEPSSSPGRPPRRRLTPLATAIAGVVLGVAAGVWFWLNTSSEPVVPTAPVAMAAEPLPAPPPAIVPAATRPAIVPAPTRPAIVPAAAVTQVREVAPRHEPARADYVGTLSIDSDPGGDVFIDRKPVGKTPVRAEKLKAGSHLVWIERDGYHRFTRVVLVPADRVSRLFADLEPASR